MLNKILDNLKQYPDDECYQIKDKIYKNKDLYKYVCNIYNYLLNNNIEKEPVIVYGHKEVYMIASFLACSFAGLTYVPMDRSIPSNRKENILSQLKTKTILDEKIEIIMESENFVPIKNIHMNDNDVYYIMFTSGSTGEPKGVKITYSNIKSCMKWLEKICNLRDDIVLNQANYSFDLSIADLYLPLLTRSKHYIIERETQKKYNELFKELKNSNASFAVCTPSYFDLLLADSSFNSNLMPNLKKILFCGEKLTESTTQKIFERFNNIEIINSYGPTECTFAVTSTIINRNDEISIGVPKDDVKIYIVNEKLEKLRENEIGEILILGDSVGDGYLKRELNNDIFIDYEKQKGYLTGDLAYIKNDKIYYVGRKDKQIKYKGYRIELSEIEKVLYKLEFIEKVCVTVNKNEEKKVRKIFAFIEEKKGFNISSIEIKKKIKSDLPDYMVPVIKVIEKMPINENGKIDEKMLLGEI